VADGFCYRYQYVVSDELGNATTYTSPDIKVDVAAPAAPGLSFSSMTNASWPGSGSTVYYRSAASSGSLKVTATSTAPSGIAAYTFPALGTGWTSTSGGTGVTTYSWNAANPAAPGTRSVTATTNAGTTTDAAPITFVADNTAPAGTALTYLDGTTTSSTVTVTLTDGTDAGSGIGTRLLQRSTASVNGAGNCGSFGGYSTVSTDPTSPVADPVSANTCYRYRYVVSDNVGNQTTVTGSATVKVIPSYATTIAGTANLQSWWRLGETTGNSAVDSKGSSHATYSGGPTLGVSGAIAGDTNTAVQLDGSDDYASVTRNVSSNFSVEFWFRSTQGIGTGSAWNQGAGLVTADWTGGNDFGVSLRSDGRLVAGLAGSSILSSVSGLDDGEWHHVVFTRAQGMGGPLRLYVDGVSVASGNGPTGALNANATFSFGRIQTTGTGYLQGALDEVAYYNNTLSEATAIAHYTTGTTP